MLCLCMYLYIYDQIIISYASLTSEKGEPYMSLNMMYVTSSWGEVIACVIGLHKQNQKQNTSTCIPTLSRVRVRTES